LAIGLVFLTVVVFLHVAALARVFLRFALVFPVAFFRLAITASLTPWIFETCAESLLDKKVSQMLAHWVAAVKVASNGMTQCLLSGVKQT
jgi:hypothetical protein